MAADLTRTRSVRVAGGYVTLVVEIDEFQLHAEERERRQDGP